MAQDRLGDVALEPNFLIPIILKGFKVFVRSNRAGQVGEEELRGLFHLYSLIVTNGVAAYHWVKRGLKLLTLYISMDASPSATTKIWEMSAFT